MVKKLASHVFVSPPDYVPRCNLDADSPSQTRLEQVLSLGSRGLTDKAIARQLGLSPGTVRTYWDRLRATYDAATRGEVIAKAMSHCVERVEQELKDTKGILDKCEVILWIAGKSGSLQFVSSHTLRFCGLPPSQVIGREFTDLMPPDEAMAVQRQWVKAMGAGCGFTSRAHLRRFDGKFLEHSLDIAPFEESANGVTRWLGSAIPIQ